MDKQPVLVATAGPLAGQAFAITAEGLVLGRERTCDVPLDDPSVSREHARVFLHNSAVWVQDSGSRNGVFVNDKRLVRPKQVSPGDRLGVGDHAFTIELRRIEGDDEVSNITVAPRAPGAPPPPSAVRTADPGGGPPRALVVGLVVVGLLAVLGVVVAALY